MARRGEASIAEIAKDFGISESCLRNWLAKADVEDGVRPGATAGESAELRELKRRNRLLSRRTWCCGGRRRICRRRTCRENDVPASSVSWPPTGFLLR